MILVDTGLVTQPCTREMSSDQHISTSNVSIKTTKATFKRTVSNCVLLFQDLTIHAVSLTLCSLLAVTITFLELDSKNNSILMSVLGWVSLVFFIIFKLSSEAQKVFCLFSVLRSPCYSVDVKLANTIWRHIRSVLLPLMAGLLLEVAFKQDNISCSTSPTQTYCIVGLMITYSHFRF